MMRMSFHNGCQCWGDVNGEEVRFGVTVARSQNKGINERNGAKNLCHFNHKTLIAVRISEWVKGCFCVGVCVSVLFSLSFPFLLFCIS